ncbi:hypothetical protein QNM99_09775, partial [Pseudomonas sp. PCH446]
HARSDERRCLCRHRPRVRTVSEERYSFPLSMPATSHVDPAAAGLRQGRPDYEQIAIGEHMYGQALQTYQYLRKRVGTARSPCRRKPASRRVSAFEKPVAAS